MTQQSTTVLVRGRDGALGRRVIDLLAADGSTRLVEDDEVDSVDIVIDLDVGDHDRIGARSASVTSFGEALLAELALREPAHLVLVSSALVYGAHRSNPVPLTEAAIVRPEHDFVFARQLAGVELAIDDWRRDGSDRSVSVLRPAVVMSGAQGSSGETSALARALAAGYGRRLGREDPGAQFVHIDDLASAVVRCAIERTDGVVNVAPDGWVPGDRVRALGGGRLRLPLPERAVEVITSLTWRLQRGPIPPGLDAYTRSWWVVANDRLRALGWEPTVTNEQVFVEGTEGAWWSSVTPKRRQEIALGAGAAAVIAFVLVMVRLLRPRRR
ncbi:MAG: NAD-dependent epimerase/dehydratase family protein [Ilumatobacteraceae bacterium]